MRKAIILDSDDIKKILAEKYGVDEKKVMKMQYSYVIDTEEDEKN